MRQFKRIVPVAVVAPLVEGCAELFSPLVVLGDEHEILIRKLAAQQQGAG